MGEKTIAWVSDTLAPLGRVPACTGAHFRHLLILLSPVGKGFLKENPGFPEGSFRKGKENLNRSKNNEAPHANSAYSTVADISKHIGQQTSNAIGKYICKYTGMYTHSYT